MIFTEHQLDQLNEPDLQSATPTTNAVFSQEWRAPFACLVRSSLCNKVFPNMGNSGNTKITGSGSLVKTKIALFGSQSSAQLDIFFFCSAPFQTFPIMEHLTQLSVVHT